MNLKVVKLSKISIHLGHYRVWEGFICIGDSLNSSILGYRIV